MPSDRAVLIVLHTALGLLFAVATFREIVARMNAGSGSVSATVERGEQSMRMLTGLFASSFALLVFAIDVAHSAEGAKSFLIVIDFAVLFYMFFFNNWFRNAVIGAASARFKESR